MAVASSTPTAIDGRHARGDRTHRQILLAARRAFARDGFKAASVRDIAREAGAHPALLRYHFGSKEELYGHVITRALGDLTGHLLAAFGGPATMEGRLTAVVDAYLDHLTADRDLPRLIQRALLDRDEWVLELAWSELRPLASAATGALGEPRIDSIVTVFGAAVAPFLYEPVLTEVFGEELLSTERLERRRAHLHRLAQWLMRGKETE